jgi:hypothetical protein
LEGLIVARGALMSIKESDLMDNQTIRKTEWFNFAFLNLRSLMTLKTTDSRKQKLATKRREHKATKESKDDSVPVESMPPLVSQFPARRVCPRNSPEPENETEIQDPSRIPSIADPEIPSAGSKLYHSCREFTTQNLGNNFCTGAFMFLFDPPELMWVNGRPEPPILHWRDEYLSSFPVGLIVDRLWRILS